MPKISCPGCNKQYTVPASAQGQVATCKQCGKKFRLGKAKPKAVPTPKSGQVATKAAPPAQASAAVKVAQVPETDPFADPTDSFWDESIPDVTPGPVPAAKAKGLPGKSTVSSGSIPAAKPKKKNKKKKGGVKWGADWGQFVVGMATFVVVGAAAVGLIYARGRISRFTASLVAIAFLGLFKGLSGLMGEEGIW